MFWHPAGVGVHTAGSMLLGQQQQPPLQAPIQPLVHIPPTHVRPDAQSDAEAQDVRHDFMSGEHR
jgi:hypothetical protein